MRESTLNKEQMDLQPQILQQLGVIVEQNSTLVAQNTQLQTSVQEVTLQNNQLQTSVQEVTLQNNQLQTSVQEVTLQNNQLQASVLKLESDLAQVKETLGRIEMHVVATKDVVLSQFTGIQNERKLAMQTEIDNLLADAELMTALQEEKHLQGLDEYKPVSKLVLETTGTYQPYKGKNIFSSLGRFINNVFAQLFGCTFGAFWPERFRQLVKLIVEYYCLDRPKTKVVLGANRAL